MTWQMWSMAILVAVALALAALEGVNCALTCDAYDAADKCPTVTIPAPSITCALKVNTKLGASTTSGCDTWTVKSDSKSGTTEMTDVEVEVCITNQTIGDFTNANYESKCRELTIAEETKVKIPAGTNSVSGPFKDYMVPKTCKDGGGDMTYLPCDGDANILVVLEKDDKIVGFVSKAVTLDCTDAVTTECSGAPLAVSSALILLVSVTLATLMH